MPASPASSLLTNRDASVGTACDTNSCKQDSPYAVFNLGNAANGNPPISWSSASATTTP